MTFHSTPARGASVAAPILAYLPPSQATETVRVAPRRTLYRAGDPIADLYEIVEGAVMFSALLEDGRRQIVEIAGPGALVGLASGDAHELSAETLSETVLRSIPIAHVAKDPALQRRIRQHMLARIDQLYRHAVLLGRKTATEKVATFLMDFVTSDGRVDLHTLTRQEIGDYLGLTIETVSRQLSRLRAAGIVAIDRHGGIRVRSLEALWQKSGLPGMPSGTSRAA
jgi:CRP/FNR family transcriptional regulator